MHIPMMATWTMNIHFDWHLIKTSETIRWNYSTSANRSKWFPLEKKTRFVGTLKLSLQKWVAPDDKSHVDNICKSIIIDVIIFFTKSLDNYDLASFRKSFTAKWCWPNAWKIDWSITVFKNDDDPSTALGLMKLLMKLKNSCTFLSIKVKTNWNWCSSIICILNGMAKKRHSVRHRQQTFPSKNRAQWMDDGIATCVHVFDALVHWKVLWWLEHARTFEPQQQHWNTVTTINLKTLPIIENSFTWKSYHVSFSWDIFHRFARKTEARTVSFPFHGNDANEKEKENDKALNSALAHKRRRENQKTTSTTLANNGERLSFDCLCTVN